MDSAGSRAETINGVAAVAPIGAILFGARLGMRAVGRGIRRLRIGPPAAVTGEEAS